MGKIKDNSATAKIGQLSIDFMLKNPGYKNSNIIARSPIFGSIKQGKREFLYEVKVADGFGVEVYQTGMQLDMADQDVFLWLINIATNNFDNKVHFSKYQLCKDLNKKLGKSAYTWLENCFNRLTSTTIYIKKKNTSKYTSVHLIDALKFDFKQDMQYVRLGEEIMSLYANKEFSFIDWSQRLTLKPFAKWLHGFLLSHNKATKGYYIKTLQETSGKTRTRPQRFIDTLEKASSELQQANFLISYNILQKDKGLFYSYQRA
jgi:hypothetical protein